MTTRADVPRYPCSGAHPPHLISSSEHLDSQLAGGPDPGAPIPRHAPGGRFLKGPIPWEWLAAASRCPGKALHVGLVVWHHAFLRKSSTVSVSMTRAASEMGFDRSSALRALTELEAAGLVAVRRFPGRSPVVTLLSPPLVGARVTVASRNLGARCKPAAGSFLP